MKIDEFMDALSGVDPKYIEEAAIELNGGGLGEILEFRRRKAAKRRRIYGSCISVAAAMLLILLVSRTDFLRQSVKSSDTAQSTEMAAPQSTTSSEMAETTILDDFMDNAEASEDKYAAQDSWEEAEMEAVIQNEMASEDIPMGSQDHIETGGTSSGEISDSQITWNDVTFVDKLLVITSTDRMIDTSEGMKNFTVETVGKAVGFMPVASRFLDLDVIFVKDSASGTFYAYYEKSGVVYLISGCDMSQAAFMDGVQYAIQYE